MATVGITPARRRCSASVTYQRKCVEPQVGKMPVEDNVREGSIEGAISTITAKFEREHRYSGLIEIENEAREAEARYGPTLESSGLIGSIMRRRLDWSAASQHLMERAASFPPALDLRYDAALIAIDAGAYGRAASIMQDLTTELAQMTDRQLRGLWRAAPLVGLHDLAWASFKLAEERGYEQCKTSVKARLLEAQQNVHTPGLNTIGLISLGENCLPWQIGQRWGLRPYKTIPEQESPFNLAQTTTDGVSALIELGLEQLISPDLLTVSDTDNGCARPLNQHFRFDFNHERGSVFLSDGFRGLNERYSRRIRNLNKCLTNERCVFLHYTEREGDLVRLATSVRRACGHDNWRLVIVDVFGDRSFLLSNDERISYLHIDLPWNDYCWFQPDHWEHDQGIDFERKISKSVIGCMRELLV